MRPVRLPGEGVRREATRRPGCHPRRESGIASQVRRPLVRLERVQLVRIDYFDEFERLLLSCDGRGNGCGIARIQDVSRGAKAASRHKSDTGLSFGSSWRSWCASAISASSSAFSQLRRPRRRLRCCSRLVRLAGVARKRHPCSLLRRVARGAVGESNASATLVCPVMP
jgi:hypothetical protein